MDIIWTYAPLVAGLLVAGLGAGILAGLLGVGGGIIMVPVMGIVFGLMGYDADVYQHVAVGTSLAVIIGTGFSSARAHYRRGAVMVEVLRLWGPFIVAGSLLGGLMAGLFSGDQLRAVFGIVVLLVALNIVSPWLEALLRRWRDTLMVHRGLAALWGYISALMGIGGGSLSVPTLVAFGHTMHKAVGTSAALGLMLAIPGALGFVISGWNEAGRPPLSLGYVNLPAMVLIGVVAGLVAPFGAALAHKLDQKRLKQVFAVFLVVVGLRMILQALI